MIKLNEDNVVDSVSPNSSIRSVLLRDQTTQYLVVSVQTDKK